MTALASHKPQGVTLPIYSVTPFTMLDFPDKTACIVWFSGCNMRCPYCHNPQIVKGKGRGDTAQLMDFLQRRQGLLDGIVLSGGECTLYPDMPALVRDIKAMGYAVKIDTNGTRPDVLLPLLAENLIDYIALDYKAPRTKFARTTGMKEKDFDAFARTLDSLCQGFIPFEVRTTVHAALLGACDVNVIMDDLDTRGYRGTYYVQNYINNGGPTLSPLPDAASFDRQALCLERPFQVAFRNFS